MITWPGRMRPYLLVAVLTALVSGENDHKVNSEISASEALSTRNDTSASATMAVIHSATTDSTFTKASFNSSDGFKSNQQYEFLNPNKDIKSLPEISVGDNFTKLGIGIPTISTNDSSNKFSLTDVLSRLKNGLQGISIKVSSNNISPTDVNSTLKKGLPTGVTKKESSHKNLLSDILPKLGIGLPEMLPLISAFRPKTKCQSDLMYAVIAAVSGERWALQMFDSWGKQRSFLRMTAEKTVGDYFQCRNTTAPSKEVSGPVRYRGRYCVVTVTFVARSSKLVSTVEAKPAYQLGNGICVPDTCSEEDITIFVETILRTFNLSNTLNVYDTDCRDDYVKFNTVTIVSVVLLCIIGFLMLTGTILDIVVVQRPKWFGSSCCTSSQNELEHSQDKEMSPNCDRAETVQTEHAHKQANHWKNSNKNVSSLISGNGLKDSVGEKDSLIGEERYRSFHQGVVGRTLLSFSAYTNGSDLLSVNGNPDAMTAVNGIRAFSMLWVIIYHTVLIGLEQRFIDMDFYRRMIKKRSSDFLLAGVFAVDTFFVLSGLLMSYSLSKQIQKNGWKIKWHRIFFHRLWRITPSYMLVFVTATGMTKFFGSGALWDENRSNEVCEKYWWSHLLYINNFARPLTVYGGHFWYLAVDMQLFILIPFMVIPFYFNMYAGLGSCIFFLLVNWITAGVLSTNYNWATNLGRSALAALLTMDEYQIERLNHADEYLKYYYVSPFCRLGPYVVGVLAGKFLAATNRQFKLQWHVVALCWVFAAAVCLAIIFGDNDVVGAHLARDTAALYNAVSRSAWGVFVSWVIIACCLGYGGPVNALLSWSPFVVLGQLSYMMYLIHPTVLLVFYKNMEQVTILTNTSTVILSLGVIVAVALVSFILVVSFELPFVRLEKIFLPK